jgi:hypothetical protein
VAKVIPISGRGGREPDQNAIVRQLDDVTRVVNEGVSFGEPQDPEDPTSTVLAGGIDGTWIAGDHNGTLGNLEGSWVEVVLEDTGATDITCTHNLFAELDNAQYAVPVSGEPNCRWLTFGVMHDGTAKDASTRFHVSVSFVGGTVAVHEIDLRFDLAVSGTTPTIDSTHPVLVSLFFVKASRGE